MKDDSLKSCSDAASPAENFVDATWLPDEQLMLAYSTGDAAAFERLYQRHKSKLYKFVYNSTGNHAVAGEIFQDIWMRVVQQREKYRAMALFSTWLYRIARNRLTDEYRRRGVREEIELDTVLDEPQIDPSLAMISRTLQPEEIVLRTQQQHHLLDALESLSQSHREAVLLKHIAGMSVNQVAEVTGAKPETVKSRLRYAFAQLRHFLRVSP